MRRAPVALALTLALLLAACSGDKPPAANRAVSPAREALKLVKVADVASPTAMAVHPKDNSVYATEKTGRVRRIPDGQVALDVSGQVSGGGEQGLLGLTFNADGSKLYVDYTDKGGTVQIVEYPFKDGKADPAGARTLLSIAKPFPNHNGGEVVFGPDGKLYIGVGDGGSGGDPSNRAQNLGDRLGKILRIDPTPGPDGKPYSIPGDNPFLERSGAAPEVWAYGLRNPWRFSWDRATHDFWVADVGQDKWEEVDFVPAGTPGGVNFGWSQLEGTHRFKGDNPPGAVLPVHEYSHDDGCSVTGGYVYRGSKAPSLKGVYVYGDACSGRIWGLTQKGGKEVANTELKPGGGPSPATPQISSFGEDAAGELYLLDLNGSIYRFEE